MFKLDGARKASAVCWILGAVCALVAVFGYVGGGYELLQYGFMNGELACILMVAGAFSAVIFFVVARAIALVCRDVQEQLRYLNEKHESLRGSGHDA